MKPIRKIIVCQFLLFTVGTLYGYQEQGAPLDYSPYWQKGARIAPLKGRPFSQEQQRPEGYLADEEVCYAGIKSAIPVNATYHATVGKDNKHFIIPITHDPEAFLEPGDILVHLRSTPIASNRLYDHLTKGGWHVSLVYLEDYGKLAHLDSPAEKSGRDFSTSFYHIIRLRSYPREVTSSEVLKQWENDPIKSRLLDKWQKERTEILDRVQTYAVRLKHHGYKYNMARVTAVSDPQKLSQLRAAFDRGDCPSMTFYCSELPATIFAIAGARIPKAASLEESVERIEKEVFPRIFKQASSPLAREFQLREAVVHFFQNERMLLEMGLPLDQIEIYRQTGELPQRAKQAVELMVRIFLAPPQSRHFIISTSELFNGSKGLTIVPSDFVDSVYDPDSDFAYAGTFVGNYFQAMGGGRRDVAPDLNIDLSANQYTQNRLYLKALFLHRLPINFIAFSKDSNSIVSTSLDNTATLFNLLTGEGKVIHHNGAVLSAAFSPDGRMVVTGSEDTTAKIVDLMPRYRERVIQHNGAVRFVSFSPDGSRVATASADHTARVMSLASGKAITITHGGEVRFVSFSPDGGKVATASSDGTARIVELSTGKEQVVKHDGAVWSAVFSANGKKIVTASSDGTAKIVDLSLDPSEAKETVIHHGGTVWSATFSPDGKRVATASEDHTCKVRNLITHEEKVIHHDGTVWSAVFSLDGTQVVTASSDTTAKIVDLVTGDEHVIHHGSAVRSAIIAPSGDIFATAAGGDVILFAPHDLAENELVKALQAYDGLRIFGNSAPVNMAKKRVFLKLLFELERSRHMTRDQAVMLMNHHVSTADYRSESHVLGVINQVFAELK